MRRVNIASVRDVFDRIKKVNVSTLFRIFLSVKIIRLVFVPTIIFFLQQMHKGHNDNEGANVNGVWNLVLSDSSVNNN